MRTSSFFGPWDACNFVTVALAALSESRSFAVADDVTVSPTYVPDLVHACLDLLIDREAGVWHLTNGHPITWAELARHAARLAAIDASTLRPCRHETLGLRAPRPAYGALDSRRGTPMPALDDALLCWVEVVRGGARQSGDIARPRIRGLRFAPCAPGCPLCDSKTKIVCAIKCNCRALSERSIFDEPRDRAPSSAPDPTQSQGQIQEETP